MANGRGGLRSPLQQKYGMGIDRTKMGQIYMGVQPATYVGGGLVPGGDGYVPLEVAAAGYDSLSPAAKQKIYKDMVSIYPYEQVPYVNIRNFYADTVKATQQLQQTTGLKITPLEFYDYERKAMGGLGFNVWKDGGSGGGGGGGGAYMGPTTSVTEQVQLTNPSTARGLVEDAIGKYLGRRPDKKEYANFMQALSAYEEESPYVTTSRTERTISSSATKSKTMGGVSPTQFAEEFARSQEGAAELQVATTAYDALIGLLSGQ